MNAVQTDKLKPGQILAEEVRDINGRLLLASGNEIQTNHIRIFKIWGISEVHVAGAANGKDKVDPELDSELVEQAKDAFMVFGCDADPVVFDKEDRLALLLATLTDLDARVSLISHEL